ncbi:MAG: TraC family protein, partial [Bdellovibrionales bacterium]|nr:TraC family protein [Bdellovibrionales bacterium]
MSIARITRERLYKDEALFNELLPYAKYDEELGLFIHSDATIWSMWELTPLLLTSTSDSQAFQTCTAIQELLDSLEHHIVVQFNWVVTFDIDGLLQNCVTQYPMDGPGGWMAQRWVKLIRKISKHGALH